MKISDLTTKTALEVRDEDLLLIEDEYDTKQITVADFKTCLSELWQKDAKLLINETLENIIASIKASMYVLIREKQYMLNTWIGSTSGNVQIALKDIENDTWLTQEDIKSLQQPLDNEDGTVTYRKQFGIQIMVGGVLVDCDSYTILSFNEEHENPEEVNAELAAGNAGFIKAHFENLFQNEIAGIKYNSIFISLEKSDKYEYVFTPDKGSFANAVPFVTVVENSHCPYCTYNKDKTTTEESE